MLQMASKLGATKTPGGVPGEPAYCLDGARHIGGVNLNQARVRNVGTCCVMLRENPISGTHEGGKYRCIQQGRMIP